MITIDSKGIYSSISLAIIGIIMSEKPRNEKSGKFLPEGKESQMIRLDKDVADLGREEIQNRVHQGRLNMGTLKIRKFVDEWIQQEEKDKIEDLLNDSWESWTDEFQKTVKLILFALITSWEEKKRITSIVESIKP